MPVGAGEVGPGISGAGGGGGGGGITTLESTDGSLTIANPHGPTTNVEVANPAPNVGVNNNTPVDTGLVPLAIQRQPIVPQNGVLPQQPPLQGFAFPGSMKVLTEAGSTPYGICTHPNGNAYAVDEFPPGGLLQIALDGTITPVAVPGLGAGGEGICTGPDQKLYIANGSDAIVSQVNTDGSGLAQAPLTAAVAIGVCVGADGLIYVTDATGAVWQVTTGLDVTKIALGQAPGLCCAAPDGNVWVASTTHVWKVEPNGTATSFAIAGSTQMVGICVGADNNLYATDVTSKKVYKISLAGALLDTFTTTATGPLSQIVSGGGGDVWAVSTDALWKITPNGLVTKFALPHTNAAAWLTVGPDGGFWITDSGTGQVYVASFAIPGQAVLRSFPFTWDTPDLLTGATVYVPAVGEVLLDAWVEIDTAWNGTTPQGDVGQFLGINTGLYGRMSSASVLDMTSNDQAIGSGFAVGTLLIGEQVSRLGDLSTNLSVQAVSTVSGVNIVNRAPQALDNGNRFLPAKFTAADPIKVCVSQDGTNNGADPGSSQGAARLYLSTVPAPS